MQAALAGGAVTITSAAGAGGNGDITFVDAVAWNSANGLTVTASRNIIVNNTITNSGTGNINMTATVAATGSITINNSISTGGDITTLSNGNTTVGASATLTTGAAGSLSLQAANGSTGGTGNLTVSGNLAVGTGTLTLLSGINGTRPSLTLTSGNFSQLGASVGNLSITGFQDITLSRALTGSGTITITPFRDFIVGATGNLTSTSAGATIAITAPRDITITAGGVIATTATGSLNLQAAGGSTGGTGNLNLNGNISVGTGALTLLSGINGTRPSLTLSSTTFTPLGASVGNLSITGFQDITLSRSLTGSGTMTITPMRDFIVAATGNLTSTSAGAAISITAPRDITITAGGVIATTATGSLNLQAAGGSTGGTGNLTISGNLSVGTGALTLLSGINGTRPSLTLNSTTLTLLGASVGVVSITGFQDVTLAMNLIGSGAITINPQQDFTLSTAQSYSNAGLFSVTASRNIIISNTFNNTGAGAVTLNANVAAAGTITINNSMTTGGNFTALANRDLTVGAAAVITPGAAAALSLQAANGVIGGTGNLTLSGRLNVGTGTLTLVSGINGTRPSWTMNASTLTLQGASVGVTSITGFQDVTLAMNLIGSGAITINPQRDFTLSTAQSYSNAGLFSVTASRNIIISNTFNNTGAGGVTLNANVAATGSVTINNSITTGGSITGLANGNLTVGASANLTTGAAGALSLQAANGVVAGTGNLTISGNLAVGTGVLTLVSGINGTRPSLTLNGTNLTQLGATIGVITINGFQDVTISRNITGSGAITVNPQRDFILSASQTLTGSGAITVLALRDIITNASSVISTGAAGSLSLRAANAVITGTGNLTLGGSLSVGTGTLTLVSGINGTRPSWTMSGTTFTLLGATVGVTSITGFQDVTVSRNFTSSGNITINPQRDFVLSASQTLAISSGASTISVTALRDVITNASSVISTGTTGSLSLRAANAVITGTGNLTLGGSLSVGTGTLTLVSGINGTRPSWTMSSSTFTMLGATVGVTSITGFQDVTVSRNFTGSGAITISPQRDFILSASQTLASGGAGALTILALRDIIANASSVIATGTTGALSLRAANAVVTGTGNLTLSGSLSVGTGTLTLVSGINGTRPSWTMSSSTFTMLGATVGTTSITGFQDVTVSRNFTGSGAVTISPRRDFILSASQTLASGGAGALTILALRDIIANAGSVITTGASGALSLRAANAVVAGTGNLTLLGNLSLGTGALTLVSGINGTRPSWTMNTTTFTTLGATVGAVAISGFLDYTLDRNLTSSGAVAIIASRDLNINAGTTLTGGAAAAFSLQAANNVVAGVGDLTILGNLSVGTGNFTLLSGNNGGRPSLTLNTTNLAMAATVGNVNTQGFATLTIARAINSTGTITNSNNTLTVLGANITSTGTQTYSNATTIAEAASVALATTNTAVTFSTTLNGTAGGVAENLNITAGTGTVTFTGIVGGTTPLGNLSVTADNLTLSANANGSGILTLQPSSAARIIVLGGAQADTLTTNGFNLSSAEMARITAGWSSVVIGNTTSGSFTNSYATLLNPTTFITGVDFTNSVAINAANTVLVRAVRDIILTQSITTTNTSANAITLVAGRNLVNNFGASALVTGGGGRWLVYSTNPTDSTGEQLLSNAFNRYTCTYGGSCPTLAAGNGLLYSYTPLLDVTIDPQSYNYGDAIIPPTGYTLQTSGYINAMDLAEGTVGGVGNFTTSYVQGNNAGTGFTITNNGSTFTSNLGYGFNYISPSGLTVGTRSLTLQVNNQTVTYGNSLNPNAYTITAGSFYSTDAAGLVFSSNASLSASGSYNYSATPWTLTASGASFTSGLGSNYSITYLAAPTGLTVNQRALAITALGGNRTYDGTTTDTVTLSDNRVVGDALSTSYSAASFADKNVGVAKSVSVTGINLTGLDSGNYTFNTTTTTTANITQRALTISATGTNKIYDALTADTVSLGDNRVAGDVLTTSYTAANFADKNVGVAKSVSVTGIGLAGTDSGNYSFNTTASTSADITQRALSISATGNNKVYDGLTTGTVTLGDNRVAGDVLTTSYTATFADKNVGVGKAVSVTGIGLAGTDSGNYTFNTTASTSADITQRALTISATGTNKVYDGTTTDAITLGDNRVAGDVLTTSYTAANFADKNVGTAKSVGVTGIGLAGTDSGNYSFNTTASTSADILLRALTISATGNNKVYDGLTTDTVTLGDNRVVGDVLTASYTANFADKNVGIGKTVSVTGIGLTGTDSSNYTFNTTASTSANISQRALTIGGTASDRVYDGLTGTTVTLSDNRVAGDVLSTSYTAANFVDKNAGIGKLVNITGVSVTGTDSSNYSFGTTGTATANITQRALTLSATGDNKVYDGSTAAGVSFGDNRIAGDVFTAVYTANFANKNVGVGKSISVTGINLTGADGGNYSYTTTASTSANITQRALTISATGSDKVYDSLTDATITLADNRVSGDALITSYTIANFADANIGSAKQINVTGIGLAGADSANYSFNSFATAFANILSDVPPPVIPPVITTPIIRPPVIGSASAGTNNSTFTSLAVQIPNTVKKTTQNPFPEISLDHIPEFLLYDDEWQKHQYRLPTVGMLR